MERRPPTDIVLGHTDMDPIFNLSVVCTCILRLQLRSQMKSTWLYTWKDNRHLPGVDDEHVEDNVPCLPMVGFWAVMDAANQRLSLPR